MSIGQGFPARAFNSSTEPFVIICPNYEKRGSLYTTTPIHNHPPACTTVSQAVPTLRVPVTANGTKILSTTSNEYDSSYFGVQPLKEDFSESFDYMADEDMSEGDAVSTKDDIISDLRSQVDEYKTQMEDTIKKLNEMEVAIFDRDCIIEDLRKKLDDVQNGLPDQIKIEVND